MSSMTQDTLNTDKIDPKSVVVNPPETKIDGVKPEVAKKIEIALKKGRR